jgi:hypothetical protein
VRCQPVLARVLCVGYLYSLGRLRAVAQNKSLFDDPAAEIQELTYYVKQDITRLNADIEELSRLQVGRSSSSNRAPRFWGAS